MEITGYKDLVMMITTVCIITVPNIQVPLVALYWGKLPGIIPAYHGCPEGNCADLIANPILCSSLVLIIIAHFLLTYTVVTNDCVITATEDMVINNTVNHQLQSINGVKEIRF